MKKIWITGVNGFIGNHLYHYLNKKNHIISGIGFSKEKNEKKFLDKSNFFHEGRISSKNLSILYESTGSPDIIFHLAGGSSVGNSLQNPKLDYANTVTSTFNLLEFIRKKNLKSKVIFSSSAAVYGKNYLDPIKESFLSQPFSPYGFNKFIAEKLCESYSTNFKIKVSIVRFFSVYGILARKQLIWDICNKLKKNNELIELFGTGNEKRDWIYIRDAVKLLELVAQNQSEGTCIYNGSSGFHYSVKDIVEKICEIISLRPKINFNKITRLGDPISLIGCSKKVADQLNFKPTYDISKGLEEYINWFKTI